VSGYRRGTNYIQGYTNVGDFATTFAYGIKNRAEIFGSFLIDTRIDRDTQPLFFNDVKIGGIVERYPLVTRKWSGNNIGDLYLGAKVNLFSEANGSPAALAVRGMAKLPTGNKDAGVTTGKTDVMFDLIASHEIARTVELSGFGGYEMRGTPDGFDLPKGAFRWGVGAGFPTRFQIRGFAELSGVLPSSDTSIITSAVLIGDDLSRPQTISNTEKLTRLTFGLTYQAKNGFFFGGGLSRNMPTQKRNLAQASEDSFTDYTDWQFRIGYHPGVRKFVPPAPMPTPPMAPIAEAPPAPPAPRHTLAVKAACDLCTVEVNKIATVSAMVTDSINCAVSYAWTAPAGTITTASARTTPWTAPNREGVVPVTVTVTCPTDGITATDTVNITVTKAVVKEYAFEDVYFDFDRSTLRPDALRVLDEAVAAMVADPTLSLTVEGNTCNIGTAEYNLALGERRAMVVRDYLSSRGIAPGRLRTVSYGEERPKFDNAREETRRLNRRAVLLVTLVR
jgi:outer membrane protein OmpA-like peptidoglycan-associated protein